ncbi:MAG TPA: tetratricopeptide repeat protein [Thermoanaerobaculia bacterium]
MNRWLGCSVLIAGVCLGPITARADQVSPREVWPQAASAIDSGDIDTANKKTAELSDLAKAYGIRVFPLYAASAGALARQAAAKNNREATDWANKAADQLDPSSPAVAFTRADAAANQRNWAAALPTAASGFMDLLTNYRSRLLSRSDLLIVITLALLVTAMIFSLALFIRYARSMAHDFREILGRQFRGGAVSVLAFALLFLPLFVWLGPVWLVFYWFIIFFGYARGGERVLILMLALLIAAAPLILDLVSHWIAGVDGPVVMSAISSEEQAYHPEALRRLQELVSIVPDNAILHLLLGNLQLQEGNEQQASVHYRRSIELRDSAGAHVNLGNLHFLDNDFPSAITEYQRAEQLDPRMAIAFYNHSIASGETYKFDDQAQKLDQAKRIDRANIERLSSNPPSQKIVMYRPPISQAWDVSTSIARHGSARTLFGNYSWFDPVISAQNPITLGGVLALVFAPIIFLKRRRAGFAGVCIKCGRTFCHRCKSARESTTYCTQCIHIYLKRDGVSLDTKRAKLEEVSEHQSGVLRRNRLLATFLPGCAQLLEGRTSAGIIGVFAFFFFVALALLVGRLAPILTPGDLPKLIIRVLAIVLAVLTWIFLTVPVYRRRVAA